MDHHPFFELLRSFAQLDAIQWSALRSTFAITCNATCSITHWLNSLRLHHYAPAAMESASSTGACLVGSSGTVVKHASRHSIS